LGKKINLVMMFADSQLAAEKCVRLVPAIRRIVAGNAGLMTGPGTNTYHPDHSPLASPRLTLEAHLIKLERGHRATTSGGLWRPGDGLRPSS
jgi:hypothetical protein